MKTRGSITIKILSIITIILGTFFSLYTYFYVQKARTTFESLQVDKAVSLIRTLESSIISRDELYETDKLQLNIQKLIWLNSDVTKASISLPQKEEMKIVSSNDSNAIGKSASGKNMTAYREDRIISQIDKTDGVRTLMIITPLHIAGQTVGTYEIILSLTSTDLIINSWIKNLIFVNLLSLIFLITLLFILLQVNIIKPINLLSKAMTSARKGNLDIHTKILSDDEIGRLGKIFNEMISELKRYKEETEKNSHELQRKVEKEKLELNLEATKLNRQSIEMQKREQEIKDLTERIKQNTLKVTQIGEKSQEE